MCQFLFGHRSSSLLFRLDHSWHYRVNRIAYHKEAPEMCSSSTWLGWGDRLDSCSTSSRPGGPLHRAKRAPSLQLVHSNFHHLETVLLLLVHVLLQRPVSRGDLLSKQWLCWVGQTFREVSNQRGDRSVQTLLRTAVRHNGSFKLLPSFTSRIWFG